MDEGVEWFTGLSDGDQRNILHALVLFCGQASAREKERAGEHRAIRHPPRAYDGGDAREVALRKGASRRHGMGVLPDSRARTA